MGQANKVIITIQRQIIRILLRNEKCADATEDRTHAHTRVCAESVRMSPYAVESDDSTYVGTSPLQGTL